MKTLGWALAALVSLAATAQAQVESWDKDNGKPAPEQAAAEHADEPPLSPAVRRIVEEEKLDPNKITGTGKGGRLTKGDALEAAAGGSAGEAATANLLGPRCWA